MAKLERPLRRGWTTGTCAAAAAKAAFAALVTGEFPDPVAVTLPRGERPSFALAMTRKDESAATAGIIKDAGDDPDVAQDASIPTEVRPIFGLDPRPCKRLAVAPGSVIYTKSGGIHGIENPNDQPLRFVAFLYHST